MIDIPSEVWETMRAMRIFDKQLQNIYASYAAHVETVSQRERNIENASAFGIDRLQYEKMENFLFANPYCDMSVMDLIYMGHAGFTGSVAGAKFKESLLVGQKNMINKGVSDYMFGGMSPFKTITPFYAESFVPLVPRTKRQSALALCSSHVLELTKKRERTFLNVNKKRWRPHETVRARLRGRLASTISPSYCTS